MRSRLTAVALAMLVAIPAMATQPNPSQKQRELIEQILDITKPERVVKEVVDGMLGRMQAEMEKQQRTPNPEDKKDFERYRELVGQKLDYRALVREIYTPLYAKYLDEQQLADLVAFYKSPTGAHVLEVLPQIEREAMQSNFDSLSAKVTEVLKQVEDERHKRTPWEPTIADMRAVATAVEAYATDENKYPDAATWSDLGKVLSPTYIKTMPQKDGWGNEYAYVVSDDKARYRIVSSGADGVFEWDSRRIAPLTKAQQNAAPDAPVPEPKYSDRLEDDIIFADGVFAQMPKVAKALKDD